MKITKEYISNNLIRKDGNLNNHQLKSLRITPYEVYLIYHNIKEIPKCPVCGSETKFISFHKGFQKFCSSKCSANYTETKIKRENTNLKKYGKKAYTQTNEYKENYKKFCLESYGVENVSQLKEIKEKKKQSYLEKYGVEHPMKSQEIKEKTKQTFIKKYGVKHPLQNNEIKEKVKQTNLKKYGVDYVLQNNEIKEKIKRTNLEKYGVEFPFQNNQIKEKIKQSYLEKYGVDNPFKSKEIKEKIERTNLEKYGTEYPMKCEEIKEKVKQTNLEKYGVKNPTQSEKIREKIKQGFLEKYGVITNLILPENKEKAKQTCLLKYGVEHPMKCEDIKRKNIEIRKELFRKEKWKNLDKLNKRFILENFVENDLFLVKEFCEFYNISYSHTKAIKKELGIHTPNKSYKNLTQEEIYNFIKENYSGEVRFNDKKTIFPYELDIYLPDLNFAIEYNGLMYHSFGKSEYSVFNNPEVDMKIHLRKTERAESKNIHLFQIFENEWVDPIKQDIWKSKILIKLHSSKIQKLNARDLIIKEVRDTKLIRKFLEENHLQGFIPSSIKIGLFDNNKLISLATFGKSRFKKDESELLRFATKKYTIVRGGLSRILNHLFKNYNINKLISYANRRWSYSKSNVYNQVGFKQINLTPPNYFYFKHGEYVLYNRIKFQKHKLKDKLEHFDSTLTEVENMFNNGYRLIPDCGNIKYVKEIK